MTELKKDGIPALPSRYELRAVTDIATNFPLRVCTKNAHFDELWLFFFGGRSWTKGLAPPPRPSLWRKYPDTREFYEQSVNFEYLYLSYFYTSYLILMARQGEALE